MPCQYILKILLLFVTRLIVLIEITGYHTVVKAFNSVCAPSVKALKGIHRRQNIYLPRLKGRKILANVTVELLRLARCHKSLAVWRIADYRSASVGLFDFSCIRSKDIQIIRHSRAQCVLIRNVSSILIYIRGKYLKIYLLRLSRASKLPSYYSYLSV